MVASVCGQPARDTVDAPSELGAEQPVDDTNGAGINGLAAVVAACAGRGGTFRLEPATEKSCVDISAVAGLAHAADCWTAVQDQEVFAACIARFDMMY